MTNDEVEIQQTDPEPAPLGSQPVERAAPIQNRFLFVDVAAQRAKQLRRGALPRLQRASTEPGGDHRTPHKLERVAMEEVRHGLIHYSLPDVKPMPEEAL